MAGLVEAIPTCFAVYRDHVAMGRFVERLDTDQRAPLEVGPRQHQEDRIEPVVRRYSQSGSRGSFETISASSGRSRRSP